MTEAKQAPAPPEERTLVCGPYIGEFGWEVFSWAPVTRALSLQKPYARTIIYTLRGADGKALLYPHADEVRPCEGLTDHESECLAWRDFPKHTTELNDWTKNMVERIREETGDNADCFTLARLKPLNDPHYGAGEPGLLRVAGEGSEEVPTAVLCIRDRGMSDFRNWDVEDWCALALAILASGRRVEMIGHTRDDWSNVLPTDVVNRLNTTSIDDVIRLFSRGNVLAVGGSTGTLHLAAQCGTPHLVWGGEKNTMRYAETNWFAAPHKVYEWGWDPEASTVAVAVDHYFNHGRFM